MSDPKLVSLDDLQAYVDQELTPERRAEVEEDGQLIEALWTEGHAICDLPAQVRLMRHPVKLIS